MSDAKLTFEQRAEANTLLERLCDDPDALEGFIYTVVALRAELAAMRSVCADVADGLRDIRTDLNLLPSAVLRKQLSSVIADLDAALAAAEKADPPQEGA